MRTGRGLPSSRVLRFFGLSVGGARSERTSLAVIDFYSRDGEGDSKAFVVDIFDSIGKTDNSDGDQNLLSLIETLAAERGADPKVLAVDAPLTLPPCLYHCEPSCQGYQKCAKPEVRWMRNQYRNALKKNKNIKPFAPYLQRPVDLYFRYQHSEPDLFRDDTLGANNAPQAARMQYLKRFWNKGGYKFSLIEVWPKLVLYSLQKELGISKRESLLYRNLEEGASIREKFLEAFSERYHIFVYEKDAGKILLNVPSFDSFVCAAVALQYHQGHTLMPRRNFPLRSGWIQIPSI